MTTVNDVVQAAWPGVDDETAGFVLWNRTAYPFEISAKRLYKAACTARRAAEKQIQLCDFCDSKADSGKWVCGNCEARLLS